MLGGLKRLVRDLRRRILSLGISRSGVLLRKVRFFGPDFLCTYGHADQIFGAVRVLQYRSVAFVTYVSELNAQFAKEAMACQSLDNDEILNVRWATEDPNPTSKVQEQWRILDMGKKAIQERMDPKLVDAMRAVKALEEGVELKDGEEEDGEDAEQRKELEALANGDGTDEESDLDSAPRMKRRKLNDSQSIPSAQSNGLLNADTLEGLKYFAEIRRRHEDLTVVKQAAPPKPLTTALALDYGSDDD